MTVDSIRNKCISIVDNANEIGRRLLSRIGDLDYTYLPIFDVSRFRVRMFQRWVDTGEFRTADFNEFARLRKIYQRSSPQLRDKIAGTSLGYVFDKQG